MKTVQELRKLARERVLGGAGMLKFLVLWTALVSFAALVQRAWNLVVAHTGVQTWTMFLQAKLKMLQSGLDLAVPSQAVARQMTAASAFELFFNSIASGIAVVGFTVFFLGLAKGGPSRWFRDSLGGFARPLDMAWLYFRQVLQITLWSLLLVFPGIMAYYRYSQAWNLKAEHPDWTAGACLKRSCELMEGRKATRFALDLSYLAELMVAVLLMTAVSVRGGMPGPAVLWETLRMLLVLVAAWFIVNLAVRLGTAQALFYLDLQAQSDNNQTPNGGKDSNGTENPTV